MKETKFYLLFAALCLVIASPAASIAVTDEEITESVKKEPIVRQKLLEITLPAEVRMKNMKITEISLAKISPEIEKAE